MQGLIESVASQFHQGGKANDLSALGVMTWAPERLPKKQLLKQSLYISRSLEILT